MLALAEKGIWGERINAGGGKQNIISLKEFITLAVPDVKLVKGPQGDYGFAFDNSKATRLTKWKPQVLIREKIPVITQNVRQNLN
jgi:nucleoside-diphosphate-sugar epimerase